MWDTSQGSTELVDGHAEEQATLAIVPFAFLSSINLPARYLYSIVQCLVDDDDLKILDSRRETIHADATISASIYKVFSLSSEHA